MLITYQVPSIGSLFIRDVNGNLISSDIRDMGDEFTCSIATFNAAVDSPNGDFPQSASLSCIGADIGSFTFDGPDDVQAANSINFSNKTISVTSTGTNKSVTFKVTTDSRNSGDTQSTSKSFAFRWRNYLAASSTIISDGTTLQSVLDNDIVDNQFSTGKGWTAECTADNNNESNFTYIIYPASYGDLNQIDQDSILPVFTAFTKLSDQTANNNQGSPQNWRIYKTDDPGAFSDGVKLLIG